MSFKGISAGEFRFDASADITTALSSGQANTKPRERVAGADSAEAQEKGIRANSDKLSSRGGPSAHFGSRLMNDPEFAEAYNRLVDAQVLGYEAGMEL